MGRGSGHVTSPRIASYLPGDSDSGHAGERVPDAGQDAAG